LTHLQQRHAAQLPPLPGLLLCQQWGPQVMRLRLLWRIPGCCSCCRAAAALLLKVLLPALVLLVLVPPGRALLLGC
jgi:hypothetical protein